MSEFRCYVDTVTEILQLITFMLCLSLLSSFRIRLLQIFVLLLLVISAQIRAVPLENYASTLAV